MCFSWCPSFSFCRKFSYRTRLSKENHIFYVVGIRLQNLSPIMDSRQTSISSFVYRSFFSLCVRFTAFALLASNWRRSIASSAEKACFSLLILIPNDLFPFLFFPASPYPFFRIPGYSSVTSSDLFFLCSPNLFFFSCFLISLLSYSVPSFFLFFLSCPFSLI
jgi:hypothetical protein